MHLHEPRKEEYSVSVRGYSYVKFEVFTTVLQCICYTVELKHCYIGYWYLHIQGQAVCASWTA